MRNTDIQEQVEEGKNYSSSEERVDIGLDSSEAGSDEEELADARLENIEEELLELEELNKVQEKEEEKEKKTEDLTSTYAVLVAMCREGEEGFLEPGEHEFLKVFLAEDIEEVLQERARELLKQVEKEFKSRSVFKKMNKQKLLKQRINMGIAEKLKENAGKYEDMPFIINVTKDFCYKKGIKLYRRKVNERVTSKISRKVYDKMVGFCVPVGEYAWSEEKNNEFIKCIFKE